MSIVLANKVDITLRIKYNKNMKHETQLMIKDLTELVAIPSVAAPALPGAPFGKENRRALDAFLGIARRLGLSVGEKDGYAGWAEYGEGELRTGMLAHLDVVPAGDGWATPPFALSIKDGTMYGRGVSDDKGPLVACLYALARLAADKRKLRGRIRLIAGCNEEEGSACIKHYISSGGEIPRYSFTPDSDFPVTASEKGIAHISVALPRSKETADSIASLTGGTRPNVVPEHCRALLRIGSPAALRAEDLPVSGDTLVLERRGVSAHGSAPEKGDNAIIRLLPALSALLPNDDGLRAAAELLRDLSAPARLGLGEEDKTGRTTLNVGTVSLDADGRITLVLDLRLPARYTAEDALLALKKALPEGTDITALHSAPPLVVPENGRLVTTLMDVYRKHTGDTISAPLHIGGGTYAKELPDCVAFGAVFPGRETHMHEADECYRIADLEKLVDIYYDAALALDEI